LLKAGLLLEENLSLEAARVHGHEGRSHQDERQGGHPGKLNAPMHGHGVGARALVSHANSLHRASMGILERRGAPWTFFFAFFST